MKPKDTGDGSQVLADMVLAESQRISAELNYLLHSEPGFVAVGTVSQYGPTGHTDNTSVSTTDQKNHYVFGL